MIPFAVLEQLMKHPLTDIGLKKFLDDWAKFGEKDLRGHSSPAVECWRPSSTTCQCHRPLSGERTRELQGIRGICRDW